MASVAIASLISTIKLEFLQPFPARVPLLHDHHQPLIQSLFERVCSLQAFLKESSGSATVVKFLKIKIRDFALKAEDDIETQLSNFLILAKDKEDEDREKVSQELHQTLGKAAENAAQLLNIIHSTTTRNNIDEVVEASETQPSTHGSKQDFESKNVELDGSLRHPPRLDNKIFGHRHDFGMIMYELITNRTDELKFIWIVGMPGIGKTTLAKSVYEDPILMSKPFDVRGWITMPQKYNLREILCNLLLSLMVAAEEEPPSDDEILKTSTNEELAEKVRNCLSGKRFLIVLDNMWNSQAWYDIKPIFPDNDDQCGSGILLTTTHFDRNAYVTSSYYVHYMTLLDSNNSWDIFSNILSQNHHLAPKFENIRSHEIVEKCEGLPQSIVTVAKRLSKCTDIQQEAKRIDKELDSVGIFDRNALTFVYNQLPHHLKVCFLYLAVFPKRCDILVKMLIRLWVVEGFANSEDEAYSYLQELIDRSLVLIINWSSSNGKIKSWRIHSTLHSFCAGETRKEGILCAVNTHKQHLGLSLSEFANSCRWLSLSKHSFDYYVLFGTNKSRSIFFFGENFELFVPPKFVRVLALVPSPFLQSENFMFLRYVHVKQWFEGLDDIVSTNPNLQVLIVSHKGTTSVQKDTRLASKIWETAQVIRHVEVSYSLSVDPPSKVRWSLQTLYWLSLHHCTMEVFSKFPNLKKLGIICGCNNKGYPTGLGVESANLGNLFCLSRLETLMIAFRKGSSFGLQNLNYLHQWRNIKKLKLKRTCLAWSEISVISMLPHLEVLKLKEASNGSDWECTDEGYFLRLKTLFLEAKNLVSWQLNDEDQFPCLERLALKRCWGLKAIPTHFEYIVTLRSIELKNCSLSVLKSALSINDNRKDNYGYAPIAIRHVDQIEERVDDDDDSLE